MLICVLILAYLLTSLIFAIDIVPAMAQTISNDSTYPTKVGGWCLLIPYLLKPLGMDYVKLGVGENLERED